MLIDSECAGCGAGRATDQEEPGVSGGWRAMIRCAFRSHWQRLGLGTELSHLALLVVVVLKG